MMGRKPSKRNPRRIISKTTPKDLAFSTAWFIGSFLSNVTRKRDDIHLVEAHPIEMDSFPMQQMLLFNWQSESGTAGCYVVFRNDGVAAIHQWFGTDPALKKDIEAIWMAAINQLERAWRRISGSVDKPIEVTIEKADQISLEEDAWIPCRKTSISFVRAVHGEKERVDTREGITWAYKETDYVMCGIANGNPDTTDLYPIKKKRFAETYELLNSANVGGD